MAHAGNQPLVIGTRVAVRGTIWRVEHRTSHIDCESIRLRACSADERRQTFLLPFDHCVPLDPVQRYRVVGRRQFFHVVAQQLLATHGFGEALTARASSIELKAFQLEPFLAMLRHTRLRIFIADSVGLGKTIQAGLIVSELSARSDAFRALLVVPAGLRAQWQEELRVRFSLEPVVTDSRWLASITRDLPGDINPWSLPGVYVASHDFLKQPEVLRGLADVRWDLLVGDEVHGAGLGTARLAALQALGARSRRIVLLSATPPDSEPAALRALAEIGSFEGEPPMTIFRRSRLDVGESMSRRTVLLPVRLSSTERLMHARLDAYAARVWRECVARHPSARLAAMVLKKRALSTARSLLASVRRRIALLGSAPRNTDAHTQLSLFEEDSLADDPDAAVLGAPGLADSTIELAMLNRIADAAERAASDESKIRALRRLLRRISEPAIVFTEYRDTVTQLADALAEWHPATLTGAMSTADRSTVQRGFARDGSLLLATDAASEGLNLHHRCRVVIHFELPWIPMRLEQRAGRVDRLGQRKRVHEIMLVARHTSERYVLGPLVRRIRTAVNAGVQTTLTSLSESVVASGVLEGAQIDQRAPTATPPFESLSLRDEAEAECSRIASLRSIAAKRPSARLPASGELVIRRAPWRTKTATILVRTRLEGNGTLLDDRLLMIQITRRSSTRPDSHSDMRRIADQLVHHLTPERIASCGALDRAMQIEDTARQSLSVLVDREGVLATALGRGKRPVQAGLFDRRALERAETDERAATLLIQDTRAHVDALAEIDVRRAFEIVAIDFSGWSTR